MPLPPLLYRTGVAPRRDGIHGSKTAELALASNASVDSRRHSYLGNEGNSSIDMAASRQSTGGSPPCTESTGWELTLVGTTLEYLI